MKVLVPEGTVFGESGVPDGESASELGESLGEEAAQVKIVQVSLILDIN